MEEDVNEANPVQVFRNRFFRFYFDSAFRVTAVGISNYDNVLIDTSTCQLFYKGSETKPNMIIAPEMTSPASGPAIYDTTWFTYNSDEHIIMDSSNELLSYQSPTYIRQPIKRIYSYPDASTTLVQWYDETTAGGSPQIIRTDSISAYAGQLQTVWSVFYFQADNGLPPTIGVAQSFQYSSYMNPLSHLNIGGTLYSLIYTPVRREVLGNSYSKAVWDSNILPYYLDFFSQTLPSSFFLGGAPNSTVIADRFDIQVTPDSVYPQLPRQMSVGATSALGARFVYTFDYFVRIK